MEGRSCVRVDFHCRVVFTCVDKIEAMYERLLVTLILRLRVTFDTLPQFHLRA